MADKSAIEWTDATWNPITGCSVVSPGCTNCYAMRLAGTRLKHHPSRVGLTNETRAGPVWSGEVRINTRWLDQPLRWSRPRMIFVCAHGDLFHESVPDEWIDRVFAIMALAPQHTFQILTKRAARMRAYLTEPDSRQRWRKDAIEVAGMNMVMEGIVPKARSTAWPLPNVWLGVSAEDQTRADERIPDLLATPAAVRFVSAEPLLGPLDLEWALSKNPIGIAAGFLQRGRFSPGMETLRGLDWVIVGGESGPVARPMHPDWARQIRDQSAGAGVPFFFKQWGLWSEFYDPDRDGPDWRSAPTVDHLAMKFITLASGCSLPRERIVAMHNIGKKRGGRLLDGREHNDMPRAS